MNIQPHHHIEAGILLRELAARGFNCQRLGEHSLFATALDQYGQCKMSFDALVDVAEKLAIFCPGLKQEALP